MSDHCDHCHPSCHAELARDWHSDWAGLGSWRKGVWCVKAGSRSGSSAFDGIASTAATRHHVRTGIRRQNITTDAANRMDDIATWIERGEHLRGDDE